MSTEEAIQKEHVEKMTVMANVLEDLFQAKKNNLGFALLIFDLTDKGRMNYVSNGCREDMICALKELVARFEGRHIEETQTTKPMVNQ